MKCGLLGRKLGHSYSSQIHAYLGDYSYEHIEIEPEEIGKFLRETDLNGINVTIPYKKDVIPYCDELTDIAKKIGAVNTIVRRDGKLIGHNTDYFGFRSMIDHSGLELSHKKVLVLGTGGASIMAQLVLCELDAQVVVISRTEENNYNNLSLHADAHVIVNCTPVGMYPNNGSSPVDLRLFPQLEGVLDMIYNPARTKLLLDAQTRGLVAQNGLWMLVAQAKEGAQWFTDTPLPDSVIPYIHKKLVRQMENIILIGMPGSGKTTVARLLGDTLNREVLDADTVLVKMAGQTIPQIFEKDGEDRFRVLESQVLREMGKLSGKIISTGGGCVTRQDNYYSLRQNGTVIWLKRSLDALSTEGRPLSQRTNAQDMYRIREPMYRKFAHFAVDNDGRPEDAVTAILEILRS